MLLKKSNHQQYSLTKRLIFEDKPADIASEFDKVEIEETKPDSINVEVKKQEYISKLGQNKNAPGYNEALSKINDRANVLKAKQNYFKEKLASAPKIKDADTHKTINSKTYLASLDILKALEQLNKLKKAGKISDSSNYDTSITAIKASNDAYIDALIPETQEIIVEFNKKLAKLNEKGSKLKITDLIKDADAMKKKAEEFKIVENNNLQGSSANKLHDSQKDISSNYFAAFNLFNAKLANAQLEGSDDDEKKEAARQWLMGAEQMQAMKLAKASAWESYYKLAANKQNEVDASNHPARQAWNKAVSLEQINFLESAKYFNQAKEEYDKALEGQSGEVKTAKGNAQKAWDAIPASISSSDGVNFSDAGYYSNFKEKLKADATFNKEWTDAEAKEKTDATEAIRLYGEAQKKYAALSSTINLVNGMMADINKLAIYDSKAEHDKRDQTAPDMQPHRYQNVLNKLYAAAGEINNPPYAGGSKLSEAITAYNELKKVSYYIEKGTIKFDTNLPEAPTKPDAT